jgi:hypothetical protein
MQRFPVDLKSIRKSPAATMPALILSCVLSFSGCAAGPDFARPAAPTAARYTAETLRGEGASADDSVQHIAPSLEHHRRVIT